MSINIQITVEDKHVSILCEPGDITNTQLKSALIKALEAL